MNVADIPKCECTEYTEVPKDCPNGAPLHQVPDALIQAVSAQCNGDSMLVMLEICNADSTELAQGAPVSFYQNDPTATIADLLATVSLPTAVLPNECATFQLLIPLPANVEIYAVVNDNGQTPTPFSLADDFPNTNQQECDYTNNIASFMVVYAPPVLNLGPDQSLCHFQVTELDAGPGFIHYQWSVPGNNEQVFTAYAPGTYTVTATDPCGGTQTAQVSIMETPATIAEIEVNADTLCQGESATLSVNGFVGHQWFPPDLTDCPTCPVVSVTPTTNTCFTVLATDGNGCYSADTVCLQINQSVFTSETIGLCEGDTIIVHGIPITLAGDFSAVFTSWTGCDSTHTITVVAGTDTVEVNNSAAICQGETYTFYGMELNTGGVYEHYETSGACVFHYTLSLGVMNSFHTNESIMICEGWTTDIFGVPTSIPGIYSMTFQAANGCDSMHVIDLVILDTFWTGQTLAICENETVDIFGVPTHIPGNYTQYYTASNGCDSSHTITLLVNEVFDVQEMLAICTGDSALIFGNWVTMPGTYQQTFQSMAGCDSTVTVALQVSQGMAIDHSGTPPCPGQENGEITVIATGGLPPYSYEWNTGGAVSSDLTGIGAGDYEVTVTDAAGCTVMAQIALTASLPPAITIEVNDVTCHGLSDGGISIFSDPGFQFSITGSDFGSQSTFNDLPAGTWPLWIMDAAGCVWNFSVTLLEPPPIFLHLPGDVTIELGESFAIQSTASQAGLSYDWQPGTWLSCNDCPTPVARPDMTTDYLLTVTDPNGCQANDHIRITVVFTSGIYVPNAFSPNGDGINDMFYPMGRGIAEVRLLRIFDRWGEMVFENANFPANDPSQGWDGKFKNKPMNPGVFAYFFEAVLLDGSVQIEKGDITLLR